MASRYRSISRPAFSFISHAPRRTTRLPFSPTSLSSPFLSPTLFSRLPRGLGAVQTLLPLHSAVSAARLTSRLGVASCGCSSSLYQGSCLLEGNIFIYPSEDLKTTNIIRSLCVSIKAFVVEAGARSLFLPWWLTYKSSSTSEQLDHELVGKQTYSWNLEGEACLLGRREEGMARLRRSMEMEPKTLHGHDLISAREAAKDIILQQTAKESTNFPQVQREELIDKNSSAMKDQPSKIIEVKRQLSCLQ